MSRRLTASAATAATAVVLSTLAVTGTAQAATPTVGAATTAAAGMAQNPPPRPPPHRFRMKFRSQQECFARAGRDHPGHRADWDCRRGPDRNDPWEYWGR